jgi:hypothetical protein
VLADAAALVDRARLTLGGTVVGTVAARDDTFAIANYGECFVRDFAVTAAAWLPRGETAPVAAFIRTVADVQAAVADADGGLRPAEGLMPASFSVAGGDDGATRRWWPTSASGRSAASPRSTPRCGGC